MEQGLAQQLMAQGPSNPTGPQNMTGMGGTSKGPTIDDVLTMLMQGATPDELLQMGIPEAMIMEALTMIEQQQGGGRVPQGTPEGLAASSVGM